MCGFWVIVVIIEFLVYRLLCLNYNNKLAEWQLLLRALLRLFVKIVTSCPPTYQL